MLPRSRRGFAPLLLDDSEFVSARGWTGGGIVDLVLDRRGGFMVIRQYAREKTPGAWESLIRIVRYDASGKVITGFAESGVTEHMARYIARPPVAIDRLS